MIFIAAHHVVHRRSKMSGTNVIDSDEEQEAMDLQESVSQEGATCFVTCSSASSQR